MTVQWREQLRPGRALHEIVREATNALVRMDAERLEELALCCADLNRSLNHGEFSCELNCELGRDGNRPRLSSAAPPQEAAETVAELEVLRRVLLETRANLTIFTRLRVLRLRQAALGEGADHGLEQLGKGVGYGDN